LLSFETFVQSRRQVDFVAIVLRQWCEKDSSLLTKEYSCCTVLFLKAFSGTMHAAKLTIRCFLHCFNHEISLGTTFDAE
jgi:hypothetical protein